MVHAADAEDRAWQGAQPFGARRIAIGQLHRKIGRSERAERKLVQAVEISEAHNHPVVRRDI